MELIASMIAFFALVAAWFVLPSAPPRASQRARKASPRRSPRRRSARRFGGRVSPPQHGRAQRELRPAFSFLSLEIRRSFANLHSGLDSRMRPGNRPGLGADATGAVACVSVAGAVARAVAASPSPSPSPSPRPWAASGFAAASYNASSLGNGTAGFSFANGGASRVFDTISRQPMLNAINVQLQKNGPVFGKLELTAGTNANVIASYPYANNPNPLQTAFDVTQLYVGYTSGAFAVQAGKFETLAGAEVIEDPANANVSRSILFGYAVPFTHTGARLTYTVNPTLSLIAGVNNGWDNLKGPGGPKTAELGIAYNGSDPLGDGARLSRAWSATRTRCGPPPATRRPDTARSSTSSATVKATPKLTFVGNFDSGRQTAVPLARFDRRVRSGLPGGLGIATWNGFAGYAQYQLTRQALGRAALRDVQRPRRLPHRLRPAMARNDADARLRAVGAGGVPRRRPRRHDRTTRSGPIMGSFLHNGMQSIAAQVLVKF